MITLEQVTSAQKANLENFIAASTQVFGAVEKVVELNLAAAKAAVADSNTQAQALLNVKDAQEFIALQTSQFQPWAEKANAYGKKLAEIATSTTADIRKNFESSVAQATTNSKKK